MIARVNLTMLKIALALLTLLLIANPAMAGCSRFENAASVAYHLGNHSIDENGYDKWVYVYEALRVVYAYNGSDGYVIVRCNDETVGKWVFKIDKVLTKNELINEPSVCWGLLAEIAAVVNG